MLNFEHQDWTEAEFPVGQELPWWSAGIPTYFDEIQPNCVQWGHHVHWFKQTRTYKRKLHGCNQTRWRAQVRVAWILDDLSVEQQLVWNHVPREHQPQSTRNAGRRQSQHQTTGSRPSANRIHVEWQVTTIVQTWILEPCAKSSVLCRLIHRWKHVGWKSNRFR